MNHEIRSQTAEKLILYSINNIRDAMISPTLELHIDHWVLGQTPPLFVIEIAFNIHLLHKQNNKHLSIFMVSFVT